MLVNWVVCLNWLVLAIIIFLSIGKAQIPSAGQSGVVEKSLRKSQPKVIIPAKGEIPNITIKDSRKLEYAGAGPSFFVWKIEIEGNTLFDNETLAPLVDIKKGIVKTLGVWALYAQEITAYYNSKGYILARAFPATGDQGWRCQVEGCRRKGGGCECPGNQKAQELRFCQTS